ncbi:hypothetical protein D3C83_134100 [compost metagenome]
MATGKPAAALPFLEAAHRFWTGFDPDSRWAADARLWLGRCYAALDRTAEARSLLAASGAAR